MAMKYRCVEKREGNREKERQNEEKREIYVNKTKSSARGQNSVPPHLLHSHWPV